MSLRRRCFFVRKHCVERYVLLVFKTLHSLIGSACCIAYSVNLGKISEYFNWCKWILSGRLTAHYWLRPARPLGECKGLRMLMVGVQPTDVGMEHTHDSRGNRCHFSYVKHGEDSPVSQDRKVKSISVCQKIPKFQSCSCLSACPSAHASRLLVLRGVRKQISIY